VTVGSLFSGIGGFDLGMERAGFEIRWQVEIDPFWRAVLAKHWPTVRRYQDVRTVGSLLERVDVVLGGPPCQPVSTQGARDGAADERWLWPELFRIVGDLRPSYVLMENVAGIRLRGLGDVLGNLAAIGYDAEWTTIDAGALGGAQSRERVYIVAYPDDGRGAGIHDEPRIFPTAVGRDRSDVVPGQIGADGGSDSVGILWPSESGVLRVADGVPDRVVRIAGLANAVIPQIAEWIGRRILAAEGY
jgi:DNA (cytosine-5)-methyltransferase 1